MSEFIVCKTCGELASFENMTYINNEPNCPSCCDKAAYVLQPVDSE
ncbi:hypothetical protein [Cytobacillus massiliigabonensis]|nr:hypothetical protein [Cytobacillus massiliigabonensis]